MAKLDNGYYVDKDTMHIILETLKYYANPCSYQGERVGGVLSGCPRVEKPTPDKLISGAASALKRLQHCIGSAPE